jgi:hypothetical protein
VENCQRCKGTGYIQHYGHVEAGLCFKCFGVGTNDKEAIALAKEQAQERNKLHAQVLHKRTVEDIKWDIANSYNLINHPVTSIGKLESIKNSRREVAERLWKELKGLGGFMTLEEIKEKAEILRDPEVI